MLVYHRTVYIPFITTLIFVSQCVELIHLRTISLIDVSPPGIVYRVLLSNKNMSPRLNINLNVLIYRHFKTIFFRIRIYFVLTMFINL